VEVDIGEEERHGTALGDLLGLGQGTTRGGGIAAEVGVQRGGEQGAGEVKHFAGFAEAVEGDGGVTKVERRWTKGLQQSAVEGRSRKGEEV
jgi:hypothetical protein